MNNRDTHFDRFDICAAWNLYLQHNHGGQDSREYKRLCQLQKHFKPSHSLELTLGLSENALAIYLNLIDYPYDHVDGGDYCKNFYLMWAGAYGDTKVLVRAQSFDDAFEMLADWLDDNAPGCLTDIDYDAAARELGFASYAAAEEANAEERVLEHAQADMTTIGHTTLKHGNAIPSWEWGGDEVSL
jgi:hypothetical protein